MIWDSGPSGEAVRGGCRRRVARREKLLPDLEREILRWAPVNILIEGERLEVEQAVSIMRFDSARAWYEWPDRPALDDGGAATVLVWDVEALSPRECGRLGELAARPATQLIAVSPQPLYACVQRGTFPSELYYRLNVVRLSRD
jgi:hypothetical protein